LSLFHLALPPTLLFLLYRHGYDERALIYQTLLTWIVLVITYVATDPEKNINWVFGPRSKPQKSLPPLVYLGLEMVVIPTVFFIPMHLILKRFF
jgi:membrane protease YdiL (CAAX protease family)